MGASSLRPPESAAPNQRAPASRSECRICRRSTGRISLLSGSDVSGLLDRLAITGTMGLLEVDHQNHGTGSECPQPRSRVPSEARHGRLVDGTKACRAVTPPSPSLDTNLRIGRDVVRKPGAFAVHCDQQELAPVERTVRKRRSPALACATAGCLKQHPPWRIASETTRDRVDDLPEGPRHSTPRTHVGNLLTGRTTFAPERRLRDAAQTQGASPNLGWRRPRLSGVDRSLSFPRLHVPALSSSTWAYALSCSASAAW